MTPAALGPATAAGRYDRRVAAGPVSKRDRRDLRRTGPLVVLAVVVILFAVVNLGTVKVDWIVGSSHAPLIVVIVVSALFGAALSWFADRAASRRRLRRPGR